MYSYVIDLIINSEDDKCQKINSLIRKGLFTPDEIIKITIFNELTKSFLPNVLENIFFSDIMEFKRILDYLDLIGDLDSLMKIRDYLVLRLKKFGNSDYDKMYLTRDAKSYQDWIKIIFQFQLDSCIRKRLEEQKENVIKSLLENGNSNQIKEFLEKNENDSSYDEIILKYANEFKKVLLKK